MRRRRVSQQKSLTRIGDSRPETPAQRADRNFAELLQELRVLQTGVQILFGFLLVFAIQPRFAELSGMATAVYVVTLLACSVAAGLFMAPVAYHRALFAQGRKDEIVRMADRTIRAGMFALTITMSGATLLVLGLILPSWVAATLTAAVVLTLAALWYALPLYRATRVTTIQQPASAKGGSEKGEDRQHTANPARSSTTAREF